MKIGDMHTFAPPIHDRMHPLVTVSSPEQLSRQTPCLQSSDAGPTFSAHSSFLVSPRHADSWIHMCKDLAALAHASPGCSNFCLAQDQNDALYFEVRSEWDDPLAYVRFEQKKQVRCIQQELASICFHQEARVCQGIPLSPAQTRATRQAA